MSLPLAHETWFVDHPDSFPLDWAALARPAVLVGVALAVGVAVVWRTVARRLPQPELAPLARLGRWADWAPRLLALHLGASLLLLTLRGSVLDPGVHVPDTALGTALLVPQAVAGVLLLIGRKVQLAAGAVVAAGPVLLALEGVQALLSCAVLVGIACFLLAVPPGSAAHGRTRLDRDRLRVGVLALRIGGAVTLVTLAVVEKLANPEMAGAMLAQEPVLDLLSPLGVSTDAFALVAGCVEVLFALLLLSGALPQVVALVAAVPFTATLAVFGTTELVGHLPVYGALLTLLLLGSRTDTSVEVSRLRGPLVDA